MVANKPLDVIARDDILDRCGMLDTAWHVSAPKELVKALRCVKQRFQQGFKRFASCISHEPKRRGASRYEAARQGGGKRFHLQTRMCETLQALGLAMQRCLRGAHEARATREEASQAGGEPLPDRDLSQPKPAVPSTTFRP